MPKPDPAMSRHDSASTEHLPEARPLDKLFTPTPGHVASENEKTSFDEASPTYFSGASAECLQDWDPEKASEDISDDHAPFVNSCTTALPANAALEYPQLSDGSQHAGSERIRKRKRPGSSTALSYHPHERPAGHTSGWALVAPSAKVSAKRIRKVDKPENAQSTSATPVESSKDSLVDRFRGSSNATRPSYYSGPVLKVYGKSLKAQENSRRTIICTVEKIFIKSWFFELPSNIRERVYSYYLFPKGVNTAPRPHFAELCTWRIKVPSLLQVCTKIRQEAIGIYYGEFHVSGSATQHVVPWLRTIDSRARLAIKEVHIHWDPFDQKRPTKEDQCRKSYIQFKSNGVELRREILSTSDPLDK